MRECSESRRTILSIARNASVVKDITNARALIKEHSANNTSAVKIRRHILSVISTTKQVLRTIFVFFILIPPRKHFKGENMGEEDVFGSAFVNTRHDHFIGLLKTEQ